MQQIARMGRIMRWSHIDSALSAQFASKLQQRQAVDDFRSVARDYLDLGKVRPFSATSGVELQLSPPRSEQVFANSTTMLRNVHAYGFDYDYTFVGYEPPVQELIYKLGQRFLVDVLHFPEEIGKLAYKADFAIRGLHFDRTTGLLLKLDSFGQIQNDTVYRGHDLISLRELNEVYPSLKLSKHYIASNLVMMADQFSIPNATLLADVLHVFTKLGLAHEPVSIFSDVAAAIKHVHRSGLMHNAIQQNPATYLRRNRKIGEYIERLRDAGKYVFLLTNSDFNFVNAGMKHTLSEYLEQNKARFPNWWDMFDVVMTRANKPTWFERDTPFRVVDPATGRNTFEVVTRFKRGGIYSEGSIDKFHQLTPRTIDPPGVLYMGDHIFSDLVTPARSASWHTVAIIQEIARETAILDSEDFRMHLRNLLYLEQLIADGNLFPPSAELTRDLDALKARRDLARVAMKSVFNPRFGSTFRTYAHQSAFFFTLCRYCDIYTSSVTNFLHYPLYFTFYARRIYFPHEHVPAELPVMNVSELN